MNPILPPRRTLPRWRSSENLAQSPESVGDSVLAQAEANTIFDVRPLLFDKLEDWRSKETPGLASEIVSYGVFPALRNLIKDVAQTVVHNQSQYTPYIVGLATKILGIAGSQSDAAASKRESIARIRKALREYPAHPFALMDFALLQTSLGNNKPAKRAVITATSLAPNHRTILRSAARFFVHADDAQHALSILRRARGLTTDPWLLAAEISVSSVLNRTSPHIKYAHDWINRYMKAPNVQFSELATAVATEHAVSGNRKDTRRILSLALSNPTENAAAQVEWVARYLNLEIPIGKELENSATFDEYQCLRANTKGEFDSVMKFAHDWHQVEPFSSRALIMASYASGVIGEFSKSATFAKDGLAANSNDLSLINNLYYAYASLGDVDTADEWLKKAIKLQQKEKIDGHTLANIGLYYLLWDDYERAERYYRLSVKFFESKRMYESVAAALASYARALYFKGAAKWEAIKHEVLALPPNYRSKAAMRILDSIRSDLPKPSGARNKKLNSIPIVDSLLPSR